MPSAVHSLRVEAVVLRHSDWGEADRLLTIYTREAGKLRCTAKGVRKLLSRKAGHLEPFTRSALQLAKGSDLWIVTQAETIESYPPIRQDLVRTGSAAYVVELLERFTYEEGQNRMLYDLLVESLERVSNEEDLFLPLRFYEIRLLDLLGFRPELFQCLRCGQPVQPEAQFFSAQEGGILCPKDGQNLPGARPISMLALKFLRHLQRSSYADAQRARPEPPVRAEMEALIQYYLTYLLERGLNTPGFLREIR